MKKEIIRYAVILVIGMAIMFFLKQCNTEIIEVPVTIEVEVPVIEVQHDTIYEPVPVPYPVKEIDTSLVEEYKKANDSLKQQLFENAVTVNNYEEVFDDEIQTITVSANVTGTLNSLSAKYKTKPRTIIVDTVIPIKVPKNIGVTLYVETGVPTNILLNSQVLFKAGIDIKSKKSFIYGLSYDTQGTAWGKIGFNF